MLEQAVRIGLARQFVDKAVGVVAVAEEGRAADARAHALGQLPDLQAVQTELALAGVADGRIAVLPVPGFAVLMVGLALPGCRGAKQGAPLRPIRRPLRVILTEVAGPCVIGARRDAVAAAAF